MLVGGVFEVSSISYMYKLPESMRVKIAMMVFCSDCISIFHCANYIHNILITTYWFTITIKDVN